MNNLDQTIFHCLLDTLQCDNYGFFKYKEIYVSYFFVEDEYVYIIIIMNEMKEFLGDEVTDAVAWAMNRCIDLSESRYAKT